MIRLENIVTENVQSLSLEVKRGSMCKIITKSEYDNKSLMNVILGLQRPVSGKVFLLDRDIYSLPEKDTYRLFTKIGVVLKDGGLISNLKAWENIILPSIYHKRVQLEALETKIVQLFSEAGIDISYVKELIGKLPSLLSFQEKRLIGLIRAMLINPELIIYDSLFSGLTPELSQRLKQMTVNFHAEKHDRTSVYITSDEQSLLNLGIDVVFKL